MNAAWIKLDILAKGIKIDSSVNKALKDDENISVRKYFYNSPGIEHTGLIPQEIYLDGLIVAVNDYSNDTWTLVERNDRLLCCNKLGYEIPVGYIQDLNAFKYGNSNKFANLYGGHALAFFSPRECYYFCQGIECGFCSLGTTSRSHADYVAFIAPDDLKRVINDVFTKNDAHNIDQLMIVGGNMFNSDNGFLHHLDLAKAAKHELEQLARQDVSIHIATMPPRNMELIYNLSDFNDLHVMFNLEVWDQSVFNTLCPGKSQEYGWNEILSALKLLVKVIKPYHAHSALLCGLESKRTLIEGATALAEIGVSPVYNVYHSDQSSRLGLQKDRPTFGFLAEVANAAQELQDKYPILPYWKSSGRNSINAELALGLFNNPIPDFLSTELNAYE